jgi:hypothetical protein
MTETVAFHLAAHLERDLQSAEAFAQAIAMLVDNMDDVPRALAIQACAWQIIDRIEAAEGQRERLVRLLHPAPELAAAAMPALAKLDSQKRE